MSEIATEKLTELLSDPASMEKIRKMASELFGNTDAPPTAENVSEDPMLDPGMLMTVMKGLNTKTPDPRADLLLALKPHLSAARRERVDKAVKLLKLASLVPMVKQYF